MADLPAPLSPLEPLWSISGARKRDQFSEIKDFEKFVTSAGIRLRSENREVEIVASPNLLKHLAPKGYFDEEQAERKICVSVNVKVFQQILFSER